MKKSAYYRTMYRRRNVIKEALLNFFLGLSSWPRMIIEVLIRRNQGERYFSASGAVTLAILLTIGPIFLIGPIRYETGGSEMSILFGKFLTWYLYLIAFMYAASQRHEEVKRLPNVFDFARFSLSTGEVHPAFRNIEISGKPADIRTIETIIEPGFFFIIGFILWMVGQPIGCVLFISSLFYSFSYAAAYHAGDNFLMDQIDVNICNEQLVKTFIEDCDPAHSKGFNFYGRRPADPDARRRMAEMFMADDETVEAF
ncbi:hypothetical protein [Spirosoma endophyticum]|uniref:Uncharacterized protein n=1 Tax=Spirosoma endophyticum TaxID=662367 RepID=A0A1I2GBP3_9BACT|nr:hypothetical protein [Spirosoma endophyticum]SFF14932.1 hypothetical protein SAMN05216167_13119 [Spirosoma endophyticum]